MCLLMLLKVSLVLVCNEGQTSTNHKPKFNRNSRQIVCLSDAFEGQVYWSDLWCRPVNLTNHQMYDRLYVY